MGQLAVIEDWHAAVGAGDGARAGALFSDDVEVGGPRGSGHGRAFVVDWVGHAGIRLDPVRWYCGRDGVVVEQDARWTDQATGELGAPVRLATAFTVVDGRIARVLRYSDTGAALAVLGLERSDEVARRKATPG